ncbi:MAG TPA: hypothetical protein VFC19_37815 [Candidatus Limnocylindrales bacterium]|nr:hypothetical protein [Candidatus Limnocylindrales bacterium]
MGRQTPRWSKRLFFVLAAVLGLLSTVSAIWAADREAKAFRTTGVIVGGSNEHGQGHGYMVRFTGPTKTCLHSIARDEVPGRPSIGDTIVVRIPRVGDECRSATGELGSHPETGVGLGLTCLAAGIIGVFFAWFRIDPDGRMRLRRTRKAE